MPCAKGSSLTRDAGGGVMTLSHFRVWESSAAKGSFQVKVNYLREEAVSQLNDLITCHLNLKRFACSLRAAGQLPADVYLEITF